MRARNIRKISLALAVFVLLGVVALQPATAQVNTYTVVDLERPTGQGNLASPSVFPSGFARKINISGQVVGRSGYETGANIRAVRWTISGKEVLGTLPANDYSSAFAVNNAGQVVGTFNTGTVVRAFLWTRDGDMRDLGTLVNDNGSEAFGINNSGQVAGTSSGPNGIRAVLWTSDGSIQDLGTLLGGNYSRAFAINDPGQVVGTSSSSVGSRAVLWTPAGEIRDLGTLPGDSSSEAFDINNSGQVVGYSSGPNGTRAFLWTPDSGIQSLGTLPGGDYSRALAINNRAQVVGTSSSSLGIRAFLWTPAGGMQDLNALIPTTLGLVLSEAHCINDLGQIGTLSGGANHVHVEGEEQEHFYRSFLLTP